MVRSSARIPPFVAIAGVLALVFVPLSSASAAVIDGSIDLGAAEPFAVLASSTVTNTGPSVIGGNVGLSPGTSITGFPPGIVNGTIHATDTMAADAQTGLTNAYGVAAGMTPTQSGLGDLSGMSLVPGVYAGSLSLTGPLTLAGTAESVWVFQASSTLLVGSAASIIVTGGASVCNVFWQVGTSATIGSGANFVGTVMANESITAQTGAVITGRLLARTGAVTLDTNTITAPSGCVTTSPAITSPVPPAGQAGTPYTHTVTASGTPSPTFTSSALPPGLTLDTTTGVLSGQPTTPGTHTFTVTASTNTSPDSTATYTVTIAPAPAVIVPPVLGPNVPAPNLPGPDTSGPERDLAASGVDVGAAPFIGITVVAAGTLFLLVSRRLRRSAR